MAKAKKSSAAKAPKAKTAVKKTPLVKKAVSPKKHVPLPWSTIHVFGYGESQAIGKEISGKAPNSELKAIAPLLESLSKKQQKGTKIKMDALHALNIFNGMFIDFHSRERDNKSQRFAWADVDNKHVNKLADEIKTKSKAVQRPNKSLVKQHKPGEIIKALRAKRESATAKAKPSKTKK